MYKQTRKEASFLAMSKNLRALFKYLQTENICFHFLFVKLQNGKGRLCPSLFFCKCLMVTLGNSKLGPNYICWNLKKVQNEPNEGIKRDPIYDSLDVL